MWHGPSTRRQQEDAKRQAQTRAISSSDDGGGIFEYVLSTWWAATIKPCMECEHLHCHKPSTAAVQKQLDLAGGDSRIARHKDYCLYVGRIARRQS
mmetsp:Transcript_11316/g.41409  ORF Transcript_11316/g.41409 Transcript_11316/m.41409 type:complete len:96 (+) Transcript_11316:60-347(+)|eukprot:scaffold5337_cov411-Prasinococcus_capsulatus_cf.AAC.8